MFLPTIRTALTVSLVFNAVLQFGTANSAEVQTGQGAKSSFALLVGVNDYAQPINAAYKVTPLKGPGNDVALMKDLLVKHYGVLDDSTHIVTLLGAAATHKAIVDSIDQQLIAKARQSPGSTIVFYFSGHGSQAYDETRSTGTGFHQTLVAYDSRREGGADILDDEINWKLEELRKYTDRITLIFDSCHSGSVWKDVTTMASRSLPSNPFSGTIPPANSIKSKDVGSVIKPLGGDYSVIVAATADETAVEDQVSTDAGPKYHGLLTYFLDKAVRSSPQLTYDQLAKQVTAAISPVAPSQHPQAEGDIDRIFLGGSKEKIQPYIHILEVLDSQKFVINAGRSDGLQDGAILSVYSKESNELSGDAGKISNARIQEVADFQSTVELSDTPSRSLTTDDKVKVVTPFAPGYGMPVFVPRLTASGLEVRQRASEVLVGLRERLASNQLISLVDSPSKAKVIVRWACGDAADPPKELAQSPDSSCSAGFSFSLVPPDRPQKIFGLTVDPSAGIEPLAKAIEARARQENLRSLENRLTKIESQVAGAPALSIKLERLDVKRIAGQSPSITTKAVETGGEIVKVGEYFRFKIANNSTQPLYVAVAWVGSGGAIGLYTPTNTGELILPGKTLTTVPPLRAGPPEGLESYKVIATTKPGVNFRVLEQPGITKDVPSSRLEWLISQTGNNKVKDPQPASELDVGDWTTAQHDIFVVQ